MIVLLFLQMMKKALGLGLMEVSLSSFQTAASGSLVKIGLCQADMVARCDQTSRIPQVVTC